jgi:hypothetical protein
MTTIEQQLLDMHDRLALQELVYDYARAVDRRDFALLKSLYEEDAIDDHGVWFCGRASDFIEELERLLPTWECTMHCVTNSVFRIDGDRAEGEIYKIAYHRSLEPNQYEMVSGGRFLDRYRKRDGKWRFAHRMLVNDFEMQSPCAPPPDAHRRAPGAADPSYAFFTLFARGAR